MFMIFNWITACFDSRRRRRSAGSRRAYSACFGCTTARQTHPRFEALESRVLLTNTFTLVSNDIGFTIASWGDMNNDGLLDLYVGGYEDWGNQVTFPDRVFFNENGKSFTIAWSDARYRARGVMACDFDRDNDLDIYVSNYRLQPNVLWVNDGSGNLQDVTKAFNALATSEGFDGGHAVGSAWGDFDNDGNFDLFAEEEELKKEILKNLT